MPRGLATLALAAALGVAAPGTPDSTRAPASGRDEGTTAARRAADPDNHLPSAIEAAIHAHVPGAAGSDWVLAKVTRTDAPSGAMQYIVATGVVASPGAPDTQVRLTGRYDPVAGELDRVSYRLAPTDPGQPGAATEWSVQRAVNYAFSQVLPDQQVAFALESAQASRVEGGGRRFEGAGIATTADGEARFVSFAMILSARGELVEFDYGSPEEFPAGQDVRYIAGN